MRVNKILFSGLLFGMATFRVASVRGEEPDRERGLELLNHFDEIARDVRKNMAAEPDIVEEELTNGLARNIGDDPRVLGLCEEVIDKSTNPVSVVNAIGGVMLIEGWYTPLYSLKRRKKIAAVLNKAMEHSEWTVKLDAAGILDDMGMGYRDSARKFYLGVLNDPPDEKKFSQMDRRWPGSTKGLLVEVIKRLVRHWHASDAALVRKVTKKYQLLEYWEREVKKINHPPWRQTEEKFLAEWRSAIEEK